MNPEQEKVRCLLVDTITLLCRNGLTFASDVKVQGLLAITIDSKEFFVIQIDETLAENLDDDDNAIDCADQPVEDELDELSSQPTTMPPSMMRKAEDVEKSSQSRPSGRKRVRRMVSHEMNDNKSFCCTQQDFLAGNYSDRFVDSLSSVSAPQVKLEDDDLLLVDSSGHSVIGQNYDYGNSGGDFRPSRKDFCDGLTGTTGAGLSSRSGGPHQVKSRQKRKRSGEQLQWSSYEGVEWTGQGDVVSSLATNYDLDETEEKPNLNECQQDMTTTTFHPTQLTDDDVDWSLIDNVAQQHWKEAEEEDVLVTPGHGSRGGHGGCRGRGGHGGRVGHGGRGSNRAASRPFVFNPRRRFAISSSSSSSSGFDKPFACRFPGCDKRFYHETHTRRHEREMHNYYRQRQKRPLHQQHQQHQQQQQQQHQQQQQQQHQPSSTSVLLNSSSVSSNVFAASSSSSAQLNGSTRHRIHHQHRHHQQQHQQQQSREPVAPGPV